MRRSFLEGIVFGSIAVGAILLARTALAGSGVGDVMNLGEKNSVNQTTILSGTTDNNMMTVKNNGPGPALRLIVQRGVPPLVVNSKEKVRNLNADQLDGIHANGFIKGSGRIAQGRRTAQVASGNANILTIPGIGTVESSCSNPGFRIFWRNSLSGTALDVWWTHEMTTQYRSLQPGSGTYMGPFDTDADALITFVAGNENHTITGTVTAHWSSSGCVFHSQAVVQ